MIIWIVLIVITWKRGWKQRALLPFGCGIVFGFLCGLYSIVTGVLLTQDSSVFALGGLVTFAAQIAMALFPPALRQPIGLTPTPEAPRDAARLPS